MAVRIIEGKIGSGKTYYAVNHILKSYYTWDDVLDQWKLKDRERELRIYTNIANMKLGYDLDEYIAQAGGLNRFFSKDYQEMFFQNCNIIYVIDEAQSGNYFHKKFFDKDVFTFFQMCRHVGSDVYFITQDAYSMPREIRALPEHIIKAVRRSHTVGKHFIYKFYSDDECFKTKRIKKDSKVFGLYRSMMLAETEEIKSTTVKHILYFVIFVIGAVLIFKFGFMSMLKAMNRKSMKGIENVKTVEIKKDHQAIHKDTVPVDKAAVDETKTDYRIIGMVKSNNKEYYIIKTERGLFRVKVTGEKKGIGSTVRVMGVN